MTFADFSNFLNKLEQTSSRLEMTEQLAELYQQFQPAEIQPAAYLMQGRLVPEYKSLEFNLSTKLIQRALAKLLERHQDQLDNGVTTQTNFFGDENNDRLLAIVKDEFKQVGDLGLVAENSVAELKLESEQSLGISQVFTDLEKIASQAGHGSQERKVMGLVELWEKVEPLSARYITRIIMGKVRLGFSTMTFLDALSWAVTGDKSQRRELEEAYNKRADAGDLARLYLLADNQTQREQVLAEYEVENGVPVVPALAQRLNSAAEVVAHMGQVMMEPKYDGLRVQIHFQASGETKVFTRSLDDISHMFPELEHIATALDVKSCILDAEAIGCDPDSGELVTFQQTITRRRKHGIQDQADRVPLRFYIFDLLEVDGQSLVDRSLAQRKNKLNQTVKLDQTFYLTEYQLSSDPATIKTFHQHQLDQGLEGAIFKKINAPYRGGRKGWRWVKMKEAEGSRGKLNDTLDCVVMGYYAGKGKRSEFGIGAILVGVRDETTDEIKTVTKIGTGLTDDQFREMKQRADAVITASQPKQYQVPKNLTPDVWTQPQIVIEVAADEITTSPTHTAGVALRFPRLISFRDDKSWEQATALQELKAFQ